MVFPKLSSLEKIIRDILKKAGVDFIMEKSFKDLKGGLYRFDFYLPSLGVLIECQGQQHYEFNTFFYKNRSEAMRAHERDRKKCNFALAKNMKLYCLPYWEIENIKSLEDILQDKFLVKTQFHNDIVYQEYKKTW